MSNGHQIPTPVDEGYFMPAEWETHGATWLAWPKNPLTFPPGVLEPVEYAYCKIIKALSLGETIHIAVDDAAASNRIRNLLGPDTFQENVRFWPIPTADVWIRDWGPTFLLHRQTFRKACVKWRFNAWGNKYPDLLPDDAAGDRVVEVSHVSGFRPGIVMEGGSFDVNGQGDLLTTEQCLLNPNRNLHMGKERIETILRQYLGVSRVVWLGSGISGDDTDGHVDDFARFVSPHQVVCCRAESVEDPNYAPLEANFRILQDAFQRDDYEILSLPMPRPVIDPVDGRRLPASYANFYIGNTVVLLPFFDDPADERALKILEPLFPTHDIVPIPSRHLVYGYGGVHCITQQEPLGGSPA